MRSCQQLPTTGRGARRAQLHHVRVHGPVAQRANKMKSRDYHIAAVAAATAAPGEAHKSKTAGGWEGGTGGLWYSGRRKGVAHGGMLMALG